MSVAWSERLRGLLFVPRGYPRRFHTANVDREYREEITINRVLWRLARIEYILTAFETPGGNCDDSRTAPDDLEPYAGSGR